MSEKVASSEEYNDKYKNNPWGLGFARDKRKYGKTAFITDARRTTFDKRIDQVCVKCKVIVPTSGHTKFCIDCK